MAFVRSGFRGIGGYNRGFEGGQLYSYVNTDDSLATMKASAYFNFMANALGANDHINLVGSDGAETVIVIAHALPVETLNFNNNQSVQSLTGAGAVDLSAAVTEVTSTGTDALTLADGVVNQDKIISLIVDGGTATLTPVSGLGYSTIAFADAGDTVFLKFLTGGWAIMGSGGLAGGPVAA